MKLILEVVRAHDDRIYAHAIDVSPDSRIGAFFEGQGAADRVVIHERTGDTRSYIRPELVS